MALEAGCSALRGAMLALLVAAAFGCGDRSRAAVGEEYERTVDPGLREEYYWAIAGEGTCGEGEARAAGSLVAGSAQPAAERCDAARLGAVAVCWEGESVRGQESPGEARCVFVDGERADCRQGPGGGRIWECVRTDAE
jgi:hypothetical protein